MSLVGMSCCLLLALVVTTAAQAIPDNLKPINPVVAPGETLVLNCTLPEKQRSKYTARNITFYLQGQLIDRKYVTYLNDYIAQLSFPNVTTKLNQGFFACKAGKDNLGFQIVAVKINPVVPKITACIVRDGGMSCTWSPTAKEQQEKVKHKIIDNLSWKISGDYNWTQVSSTTLEGSYEWTSDQFVQDAVYLLRFNITANYINVHVVGTYTINSSEIIQVPPLDRVSVKHLSATSVILDWPPIEDTHAIIYRIKFSQTAIGYEGWTKELESNTVTLDGVTPYQPYDFTIEAKTKNEGYWSVPLRYSFFSQSDVPARHPEVKTGGFKVKDKLGGPCVQVVLYWKEIDVHYQHGPQFHYEVDARKTGQCNMACFALQQSTNHVLGTIPKKCAIDVTITSVNANGMSNAPKESIHIMPTETRPAGPSNVTVIASGSGDEVTITWNPEPNNTLTTGYTVYWAPHHYDSSAGMNWQSTPADVYQLVVKLEDKEKYDFTKYMFAVSREEGSQSSGMFLSGCTFQIGQFSPPPADFAISKIVEPKYGQLTLEWKPTQCSTHRGYIYAYELHYCQTSGDDCDSASEVMTVQVSSSETSFILVGLAEEERYCVRVTSLTSRGPSRWPSLAQCAVVPGPWLKPGYIVGFVLGGIFVLLLVVFGIIRFGNQCHRLYSKFQRGLRVELPRTTYSTQFSVSSHKDLIDQNHSFTYNVEDYSSSGLAKQHSQDSTADSGRGSMSHDHVHPPIRRSNSGESDEVFVAKNGLHANIRVRQPSEPMGGYARVTHGTEPEVSSGRPASMGVPSPGGRPKLPTRNLPLDTTSPGSMSSLPQHYNVSSHGNSSIPSYVMVGGESETGDYSIIDPGSTTAGSINSSPISDYTRAKGATPNLTYKTPESQSHNICGYVMGEEIANQGIPIEYVTSPESANQGTPPVYGTGPEIANQGAPLGYVTGPEIANQRAPLGYVTGPEIANQRTPVGYVTGPEIANQRAPVGYVTGPEIANQRAPVGYVTGPEIANQRAPVGYVTGPEIANQRAPVGYVTGPEAANHGAPLGYVVRHNDVTGLEASNQTMPAGYVASPDFTNQPDLNGYVATPDVPHTHHPSKHAKAINDTEVSIPEGKKQTPSAYVTMPEVGVMGQSGASYPGGYVSPVDAANLLGTPEVRNHDTDRNPAPGVAELDYVQTDSLPLPLAVSTPRVCGDGNYGPQSAPVLRNNNQASVLNRQLLCEPQPQTDYVPFPPNTDSTLSQDRDTKTSAVHNSDANHNNVSYVRPQTDAEGDNASDSLSPSQQSELQTDGSDETSFLLPSNGGHKVLNKSGYVVINT